LWEEGDDVGRECWLLGFEGRRWWWRGTTLLVHMHVQGLCPRGFFWLVNSISRGLPHGTILVNGVQVVGEVQLSKNWGCKIGFWWDPFRKRGVYK